MNVLLIEDNEDDAELIKEALAEHRDEPFDLDWVARLDTGLEKLTQGPVDAILVDLSLPDSQGLETVDRVLARFHDAPVVVLTGLDDEAVAEGALRRGAQDYLVKGRWDADALKRAIRYAVGRNSVEQALRKSEERFQLACRATSDGIWDWDIDVDELWWNDTFEAVFGHQENTGRGAVAWSERIHPDERAAIVTTLTSVVHSERNLWTAEYRFLRTDGTYAHVLDRGYVLRDQHGTARRMIGAMTDITEQKQAEIQRAAHLAVTLALDESVTLGEAVPKILRAICELKGWALGAMWLINAHKTFLRCDAIWHTACPDTEEFAASYRALTLQPESGLAGTVWKLGQPYLVPNVLKDPAFPASLEAERAGLRGAIAFPIREGTEIKGVMEFFSREVMRPNMATLQMVSELGMKIDQFLEGRNLEQQLRQAQKMEALGRMAGGIAHDFNNLLTVINSWSELLLEASTAESRFRRGLTQIKEAGDRAAGLTKQLLSFTRHQIVEQQVLTLNDRVMDIVDLMQRVIGEDINLVVNLEPRPGRVKADPGQIEQVVMNLVVNARDAMPHGGRLEIETANMHVEQPDAVVQDPLHPGPYVTLTVRDTGCGMDPETLMHIFEPFFTTKERGKGTGLGLATVYGIVKQSGGSISVESLEGKGTAFTIYLPQVTEERTESRAPFLPSDTARGSEIVLLVEDDDMVRALAQTVLEIHAYTVLPARNAEEALSLAQAHLGRIDLLMTDMVMPGMAGSLLAERLKTLRPDMKILVTSGYDNNGKDFFESLGSQASFLQKPYTPEMLTKKLREVLDPSAT